MIYFYKQNTCILLTFTIVSFIYFSFISAQVFMISFLLLTLGFYLFIYFLLFPVDLGVKVGCLFHVFLVS